MVSLVASGGSAFAFMSAYLSAASVAVHLLMRLRGSVVSQGQSGLELYDWKQVARFSHPD